MSNANFTPTLGKYKDLHPFRYWCQKVLPLVYDDSLSYYELLCKVVDYLNKTMEDIDTLHGDVTNLHKAYVELQGYVNNYFNNLDVQNEINNKLDAMLKDGSLTTAIVTALLPMQPKITNSTQAYTEIANTANTYVNRNDFVYGYKHAAFRKNVEKVDNKYEINCSTFVMLLLLGVTFNNSKYNGKNNIMNSFLFENQDIKDFYSSGDDADDTTWKFSGQLCEWLYDRGYCFKPKSVNELKTGDILFYNLEGGGTDPSFFGINHSAVFSCVNNDAVYTVWEVGTVPKIAKYLTPYFNQLVMAARLPYSNYTLPVDNVGASTKNTIENFTGTTTCTPVNGFKKDRQYTLIISIDYDYNKNSGKTSIYPGVSDSNNTSLASDYGETGYRNLFILPFVPVVDTDFIYINSRSSVGGLPTTGTLNWYNVIEGFNTYPRKYYPALKTPVCNKDISYRRTKFANIISLKIDSPTLNTLVNYGSINNLYLPLVNNPLSAIAISTSEGAIPCCVYISSEGKILYRVKTDLTDVTAIYAHGVFGNDNIEE